MRRAVVKFIFYILNFMYYAYSLPYCLYVRTICPRCLSHDIVYYCMVVRITFYLLFFYVVCNSLGAVASFPYCCFLFCLLLGQNCTV